LQAVVQKYVDNSISKTINIPEQTTYNDFKDIYKIAYGLKLKGSTTFRSNSVTGSVLEQKEFKTNINCCTPEREVD
jgi:ribonucleoside-diphosphate reductase alpha chain